MNKYFIVSLINEEVHDDLTNTYSKLNALLGDPFKIGLVYMVIPLFLHIFLYLLFGGILLSLRGPPKGIKTHAGYSKGVTYQKYPCHYTCND